MGGDEKDERKLLRLRREEDIKFQKKLFKEAYKELLQEFAAKFGWWAGKVIALAITGAVIYFVLSMSGWVKT